MKDKSKVKKVSFDYNTRENEQREEEESGIIVCKIILLVVINDFLTFSFIQNIFS